MLGRQPVALLFAKQQLYRYEGKAVKEQLVAFAQGALDGDISGEEIPAAPCVFEKFLGCNVLGVNVLAIKVSWMVREGNKNKIINR